MFLLKYYQSISKIMHLSDKQIFLTQFFNFQNPQPLETLFSEEELKSNDMKISLEIATQSYLRMQSDPKTNLVSFSCKNYGKNCFQIFGSRRDGCYVIGTDYKQIRHQRKCQLNNECFSYLKIYNLMKLKKNLIESCMVRKNLLSASPSEILSEISQENEYFFQKNINYNPQMRRKLRKRFDNIINIDIKKITKGGRDDSNQKENPKILKEKKNHSNFNKNSDQSSLFDVDQTSFFNEKPSKKRTKIIKKNQKFIGKSKNSTITKVKQEKQNIQKEKIETFFRRSIEKMEDEIYVNPASESELKEIKELNEQFNGFQDIFSWQSDDPYQPVYPQTINDKLRQSVFLSSQNSMFKRSLLTQSMSNFSENIDNLHDLNEEDQII